MEERGRESGDYVQVYVWDWQTRLLHWINASLVLTLIVLALGAEWLEGLGVAEEAIESVELLHAYLGHVLIVTFALRIIWGFAGNEYARWSDIIPYRIRNWKEMWGNIRWILGGFRGVPPVSFGHNPFASLFYCALFLVLISQAISGLVLSGEEFGMFPGSLLAGGAVAGEGEESELAGAFEELHEFGHWFIIFFVFAHIFGLLIHELGERRGLLSSMVHGRKFYRKDELD